MSVLRSCPLAAWTNAWIAGRVSLDQVVDAVTGADLPHTVAGDATQLRDVLVEWRRAGEPVRVVLPVPGDVRGLPGPAAFRAAALEAGEAVIGGPLGAVPTVRTHGVSSAPPSVRWDVFEVDPAPVDHLALGDAQAELTTAIRECASALAASQTAGRAPAELASARQAGESVNLPPGFPQRAVALVAQAERLQAVLDLAVADPLGGAVDQAGIAARTDALRPLLTAVRRARVAGYNALAPS